MQQTSSDNLALEAYVRSRQIGEAIVTVVCEAYAPWAPDLQVSDDEWRRAMPEADPEGTIPLDFLVACVRIGDAIVLIDPGFEEPFSPRNASVLPTGKVLRAHRVSKFGLPPAAFERDRSSMC